MGVIDLLGGGSANETAGPFFQQAELHCARFACRNFSRRIPGIVVGVNLVEVTVQVVETLTERMAFWPTSPKPHLLIRAVE